MFKTLLPAAMTAIFATLIVAQNSAAVGYSGVLTKTDGGLGGTVTVKDTTTLEITSYTLKDASAPALYWWGTTDGVLKDGFRISNTQVTMAASSNTLEIKLDTGKTIADFNTVGLWCERLSANFGQATLAASSNSGAATGSGTTSVAPTTSSSGAAAGSGTTSATPAATSAKSEAMSMPRFHGMVVASIILGVSFAAWMA